ncbi:thioredoxin [Ruminococcus sp. YRD2003]|uniref:thioredoxin n=1 Tax=Ruminococcus sp. YRD2003 TaxID=1452313 RepID=UPI0008C2BEF6|nr:thioredoxin [Ruminococcus sp.]SEK20499.1 thioredoxin [Ruminococcus flavefaciens]
MINEIKNNDFDAVAKAQTAVVDFNAAWCGPCRMLAPILEELSQEYSDIPFYACDVDENMELAVKYGIQSIPAVGLFKNGQLVNMAVGFRPKDAMKALIESVK